jgi:hypothetical protein
VTKKRFEEVQRRGEKRYNEEEEREEEEVVRWCRKETQGAGERAVAGFKIGSTRRGTGIFVHLVLVL